MKIDYEIVKKAISELEEARSRQEEILRDSDKLVLDELPFNWKGPAADSFGVKYSEISASSLKEINSIIEIFRLALQTVDETLSTVEVDLSVQGK